MRFSLTARWTVYVSLALLGSAIWVEGVRAQEEDDPLRLPKVEPKDIGYSVRRWTVDDGLPRQQVNGVAYTPDGYLWCTTGDCLVRYDGVRFRNFFTKDVPALNGISIGHLVCDREGRLWIIGWAGAVAVLEDGRFRRLEGKDIRPEQVRVGVRDAAGHLWFRNRSDGHLYTYEGNKFVRAEPAFKAHWPRVEGLRGARMWKGRDGIWWVFMDGPFKTAADGEKILDRHLFRVEATEVEEVSVQGTGPIYEPHLFFELNGGPSGLISRDGVYAYGTEGWSLHHRFEPPIRKRHGGPRQALQDSLGNFWIGTYYGGLVFSPPGGVTRHFVLEGESRRPEVLGFTEDGAGNFWASTMDGLYQIRRLLIRSWGVREKLPGNEVSAVAEGEDGRIWVAHAHALASIKDDQVEQVFYAPEDYRIHGVNIERLCRARDGAVWAGLRRFRKESQDWEFELWKCTKDDFTLASALPQKIYAMWESGDDVLFIGTGNGLFTWSGGVLEEVVLPQLRSQDGERAFVRSLAVDAGGRLVAAVQSAGLYRREPEGWKRLTGVGEEWEGVQGVQGLSLDSDGALWVICGAQELGVWKDEAWTFLGNFQEEMPRQTTGIACDDEGGLWVTSTTGEGLLRFSRRELLEKGESGGTLKRFRFDGEDGLPSTVAHADLSPLCKDREGRLWIATNQGVARIDPHQWAEERRDVQPPKVYVEKAFVNDALVHERVSGEGGEREVVVPPGRRRVQFNYTGIDLSTPSEVTYRYRLEGYEDEWIEAEGNGIAVYPDLPPGEYLFHVTAATRYGIWNEEGDSVVLTIEPKWWERVSIRVAAVVAMAGLLWLGYMYRLRQVTARTKMQEDFSRALIRSQENERKRLASDLHDGLGHELLLLKGEIDQRNGTGRGVSTKVGEVIQQVREISHDLRPPELERFGIGSALESICHQTEEATGIDLVVDIEHFDERLPLDMETSLFRIAQEALSNMARHSDASEGRVSLESRDDQVILTVEDDGRGFDPSTLERSEHSVGLGLPGMEERARLFDGSVEFISRRRGGARIVATIPTKNRK